jgi:hypothetical protein
MSITGATISETEYKADLEVLDRYQAYSAEVARLATLMIVAFGFLLSFAFHDGARTQFGNALLQHGRVLQSGIISLGAAIGFALAHRYVSTEVLTSLIRSLRLSKNTVDSGDETLAKERKPFLRNLRLSGLLIAAASLFLVIGAACIALSALAAVTA